MFRELAIPVVLLAVCWTAPAQCDPISDRMRKEDPRLEKRLTLRAPRVFAGELLERLSTAAGLQLRAGENDDGAGDDVVSAFFVELPLADALNALWSLLSYRNAEWHWARRGSAPHYSYHLLRPRAAQILPVLLRQEAAEVYDEHAAAMLAGARMKPLELAALMQRDPTAARLLKEERTRSALGVFLGAVQPEDQRAVLRGEKMVTIPASQLPDGGRQFIRRIFEEMVPPETRRPTTTEPDRLDFYARRSPDRIFPSLVVQVGWLGGYGYLGGTVLHEAYAERLDALWMLPGDSNDSSLEQRRVQVPPDAKSAEPDERLIDRRLGEVARGLPASVLARIPQEERASADPGSPDSLTAREFLSRLAGRKRFQWKWRGDVLLLTYPAWFVSTGENARVPYRWVNWLRERVRPDGVLPLTDLFAAAARLDESQLLSLKKEFPVLEKVAYWRPVLRLAGLSTQTAARFASARGLDLSYLRRSLRGLSDVRFDGLLGGGKARSVRITEHRDATANPSVHLVFIEVLARDGKRPRGDPK